MRLLSDRLVGKCFSAGPQREARGVEAALPPVPLLGGRRGEVARGVVHGGCREGLAAEGGHNG